MKTRTRHFGFTLVEMMVSLAVMIIIFGIVAAVFKSSSDAVARSNAATEIHQNAEVLRKTLEKDLAGLNDEMYLYLASRSFDGQIDMTPDGRVVYDELDGVRYDSMMFLSAGDFEAFEPNNFPNGSSANAARILYQHATAVSPSTYGDYPKSGMAVGDPTMNRNILCRVANLFCPNETNLSRELVYAGGQARSLGEEMAAILSGGVESPPIVPDLVFDASPAQDWYTVLTPHCGTFRVEYRYRYISQATGLPVWTEWTTPPTGGIRFITGGPVPAVPNPFPTYPVAGVPPIQVPPWPDELRFTVRLYDRNLTVSSFDENLTTAKEHGGLTFQFVIPIPK